MAIITPTKRSTLLNNAALLMVPHSSEGKTWLLCDWTKMPPMIRQPAAVATVTRHQASGAVALLSTWLAEPTNQPAPRFRSHPHPWHPLSFQCHHFLASPRTKRNPLPVSQAERQRRQPHGNKFKKREAEKFFSLISFGSRPCRRWDGRVTWRWGNCFIPWHLVWSFR